MKKAKISMKMKDNAGKGIVNRQIMGLGNLVNYLTPK